MFIFIAIGRKPKKDPVPTDVREVLDKLLGVEPPPEAYHTEGKHPGEIKTSWTLRP